MGTSRQPLPSAEEIAQLPPDGGPEYNRLIFSSSPYLLQHARNPVDWYPWGDEAFERAKRENKPVLLSVGYSTCYWCHVMERECFEHQDVAEILNSKYICIKVDREERPDIDSVYITAMQLMVGSAGWPNNVWLTADREPWYAATYVPREDGPWGEGFIALSKRLAEKYRVERQSVESMASELAQQIERLSLFQSAGLETDFSRERSKELLRQLSFSFDSLRGGIGLQPKFPPHGSLAFWCYEYNRTKDEKVLTKVVKTQDAIVSGGLRDHVGGGFHRYCTDQRWVLPHFEKMLYDNALLARSLCDAWVITGKAEYRRASEEALDWALAEMRDRDGGFYSAVDAETMGEEGRYYTFGFDELRNAVGPEHADWFAGAFNAKPEGNYLEEHSGRLTGQNVLYRSKKLEALAEESHLTEEEVQQRLDDCLSRLRQLRLHRERPHVDDKVLTSWNALMAGSLAYCGMHFGEGRYVSEAQRCSGFLLGKARSSEGRLCQSWRQGRPYGEAYLDSYAYLASALIDLFQATGEDRWLEEAERIVHGGLEEFRDKASGGYFFTRPSGEQLIAASKTAMDDVIPAGNGIAAQVLVRLSNITGKEEYDTLARSTIAAFSGQMSEAPLSTQSMYLALNMLADRSVTSGQLADVNSTGVSEELQVPDVSSRQSPVTLDLFLAETSVRPGSTLKLRLRIGLDRGFHVNSATPLEDMFLPTSILAAEESQLSLLSADYPPGQELESALGQGLQSVYLDGTWIELLMQVPAEARGECRGSLQVNVQPCDHQACQLPQVHPLEFNVKVSEQAGSGGRGGRSSHGSGPAGAKAGLWVGGAVLSIALLVAYLSARRRRARH